MEKQVKGFAGLRRRYLTGGGPINRTVNLKIY